MGHTARLNAAEDSNAPGGWTMKKTRLNKIGQILAFCCDREDGNAITEFAMIAPILIMMLVAIFQFGIAFNNQLTLTQAVGASGQYLQTLGTSASDPCASALTAIENAAPQLAPTSILLTVTANGTKIGGNSCSGDGSDLTQGVPVTVSATYPCNITIFGLNLFKLYKWTFNCNLSAQVTEYEY